jgi:diguanylate cyclase (GGDEF)-like protein
MKTLKQTIENISNATGEFKDRALEQDFQTYILQESINHSRRYVLAFGIVFLLFILPDYFFVKNMDKLPAILLIRVLFLSISIYYNLRVTHVKNSLYSFSTVYELVSIIVFWAVFSLYTHPDITIHHQVLIIFILAIFFTIPNSFLNKLVLTFLLTSGFFYIAAKRGAFLLSSCGWDICSLTIIILIFCSLIVKNINKLQRIQFIDTQALERLSSTDALTGALNRRKYDQDLEKEITRAQRYQLPLSGIMLDLDNFKRINDEYGHLAGDKILVRLCSYIRTLIRKIDQIYRWGGEEFIIILPNTRLKAAEQLANRIQNFLQKADFSPASEVACSFGVTSWNEYELADSFTNRLDQLLYQAKRKGKGCIVSDNQGKV